MIQLLRFSTTQITIPNRIPFRYGIATMTEVPHLLISTEWNFDGSIVRGISSENLPPRWFTKIPSKSLEEEIEEMKESITFALIQATQIRQETIFEFWHELHSRAETEASHRGCGMLLMGLGVSLVERGLLDAWSQYHQKTLATLVHQNLLGIQLDRLYPELKNSEPKHWLPTKPLDRVTVRQTVGLGDPLTPNDLRTRLNDGLPECLEELIRCYRLREFKIKLIGKTDEDVERLRHVFGVIESSLPENLENWKFSLDGNENFHTASEFRSFWEHLITDPKIQKHLNRLLFVEQPIHRDQTLLDSANWKTFPNSPPILIDESDTGPRSVQRALELGSIGVSHKNCKGVIRGVANACLMAFQRQQFPQKPWQTSGEDLANTGPIALLQDLTVQALLGNQSVERNGHHYFRGLSAWSREIQNATREDFPRLFKPLTHDDTTLAIHEGCLDLRDLQNQGLGAPGPQGRKCISAALQRMD